MGTLPIPSTEPSWNAFAVESGEQQKQAQSDKLEGQSIVISGVFQHHSRDEYKALIEQHGGKNVGSISAKTSFVLAGDNMGPAKLEKAQKLGIRIMSEDEFLSIIDSEEGVSKQTNRPSYMF